MSKRHFQRLTTTVFVVLALLFSQLALANYLCPEPVQSTPATPMQMAAGEPCEGLDLAAWVVMDQEQPGLCHQHCANPPQSFDPLQVPAVSLPAVVQVLVVPILWDAGATESVAFDQAGRDRPPPDPLFLSTLRLRV